jgi:hypothetical protein
MPFMTEGAEAAIQAAQKGDGKVRIGPPLIPCHLLFFHCLQLKVHLPTRPRSRQSSDRLRQVSQRRAANPERGGKTVERASGHDIIMTIKHNVIFIGKLRHLKLGF